MSQDSLTPPPTPPTPPTPPSPTLPQSPTLPPPPLPSAQASPQPSPQPSGDGVELRAALLLAAFVLLLCGAGAYLMYARGLFEATQQVVLIADDSEGVVVGMSLTFSGFAIGRVHRIELADDGNARIVIDVPRRDAHWLRTSSVFTLSRGMLGNTAIRAYSGILADPPLADGAVRKVLVGDATAEIPRLVAAARDLVGNLTALTASDAALATALANAQSVTAKLDGPGGAIGLLTGNEADRIKLLALLDQTKALMSRADSLMARADGLVGRADGLAGKVDGLVGRADAQLLGQPGQPGLVSDARAMVTQLNTLLTEARDSLKKVDGVLEQAQGVAANARAASTDLGSLRAEVESSLRKLEHLVNDINRRWPFARDTEVKLP